VSRRAALAFVFALLALLIVAMARAGNHGDGHIRRFGRGMVAFDHAGPETLELPLPPASTVL
jgi:Na+-transporting methylmalonyl-CoA/oxaloacetate decarboxylase gamma subunit